VYPYRTYAPLTGRRRRGAAVRDRVAPTVPARPLWRHVRTPFFARCIPAKRRTSRPALTPHRAPWFGSVHPEPVAPPRAGRVARTGAPHTRSAPLRAACPVRCPVTGCVTGCVPGCVTGCGRWRGCAHEQRTGVP